MNKVIKIASTISLWLFSLQAQASPQVHLAQDQLIEKFKKIQLTLSAKDPSREAVTLRLADLLSQRAREIEAGVRGCKDCDVEQDRRKALKYYQSVLKALLKDQKSRVLLQVAHLQELLGQTPRAISTYKLAIQQSLSPEAQSETHLSLGQIYFRNHKYRKALKHYDKVLALKVIKNYPLAARRKAWSLFNLGQVGKASEALIEVLSSKVLLSQSASGDLVNVGEQYAKEVSKELGVFLAKDTSRSGMERFKLLKLHTPRNYQVENLSYFGHELERLGQTKGAVAVLERVMALQENPRDRLGSALHLAALKHRAGNIEESLKDFKMALDLWQATEAGHCKEDVCEEWKTRLRKYVLDWHHLKRHKKKLLRAYENYLLVFERELDMWMWSVQLAIEIKNYSWAQKGYRQAQSLVKTKTFVLRDPKFKPLSFESLLLAEVELSEKSQDKQKKLQAYDRYLSQTTESSRTYDVKYQKARIFYEDKRWDEAFVIYEQLAFLPPETKGLSSDVRTHSREFALKILEIQKKDKSIEAFATRALSEENLKPKDSKKLLKLAQTSVLNQLLKSGKDPHEGLKLLSRINVYQSSPEIKKAFYKNKLILSEKTQDYAAARQAARELLKLPNLKPEDKQMALTKQVWFSELMLDFSYALSVFKKIKTKEFTEDEKLLKLAILAELAGKDYQVFYKKYLKTGKDSNKKLAFATRLLKLSKSPEKDFWKYQKHFKAKPKLYASLYLESQLASSKKLNIKKALKTLSKTKDLAKTPESRFLWRLGFIESLRTKEKKLQNHKLSSKPRLLRRTLTQRVKLLDKVEKLLKKAIAKSDWSSQVLCLDVLAKEFRRFYGDIFSLEIPEGLTAQEQNQYMLMLSEQAGPYKSQGESYEKALKELWKQEGVVEALARDFKSQGEHKRALMKIEIEALKSAASQEVKGRLDEILKSPILKEEAVAVSLKEIEEVKSRVRKNPLNIEALKNLLVLEEKMKRQVASEYLKERIAYVENKKQGESL